MEIALKVDGMMCDGCAESVTAALTGTGKVEQVKVNLEAKMVRNVGLGRGLHWTVHHSPAFFNFFFVVNKLLRLTTQRRRRGNL